MNQIKIGLDFGTHQTKICVQTIPDEGHGVPSYEFFQFTDLKGDKHYYIPSVIQINDDDSLSYGFVDDRRIKQKPNAPQKQDVVLEKAFDVLELADNLFAKYATDDNTPDDKRVIENVLNLRLQKIRERNVNRIQAANIIYEKELDEYKKVKNLFRYFKQATFIGGELSRNFLIPCRTLCVWYLAYIIFLLEEKYGTDFSINMGVPADESTYKSKKQLAVSIIATSYNLVENVYKNDFNRFLHEKVDALLKNTVNVLYSDEIKENYNINIFPEAYASLIALTSRGKLPMGKMSLTADIGGGTTDVSFFTVDNGNPMIYRYWSISKGLNYIAEESGFDYADGDFASKANMYAIDMFNRKKQEIVFNLVNDLKRRIKYETNIPVQNLTDALKDRILVYSGGGSSFRFLANAVGSFTDVRIVDSSVWNEEMIKDKAEVSKLSFLLTTAYGLSVCKNDEDVQLRSYSSLYENLPKKHEDDIQEISKDQC